VREASAQDSARVAHPSRLGRGPKLTDDQRRFCVYCFAHWKTPQQTADALKDFYGVSITRQCVATYSPKLNPKISEKWRSVFDAERKRFVEEVDGIAIAHLSYRLEMYDRIVEKVMASGDSATALAALEQAAKDKGGVFTNTRQVHATGSLIEQLLYVCNAEDPDFDGGENCQAPPAVKRAAA
jgi:hypothetical protein